MSRTVLMSALALSFLSLAALGAGAPAKPLPNTVSGRVVDERGKPVPGVKIIIEPAMFRGTIFTTTDAQGRYQSIELNPMTNPYYVTAYKEVMYHGQRYCLRMAGDPHPYQDAFNAKAGAVRNFVWKVRGPSDFPLEDYGSGSWGGTLAFERVYTDDEHVLDREATVEVTLVPDGPLMDGSAGVTLKKTTRLSRPLADIPAGAYKVSVALKGADGTATPLRVGPGEDKLGSTTTVLFRGFDGCGHSGTLRQTPIWLARP